MTQGVWAGPSRRTRAVSRAAAMALLCGLGCEVGADGYDAGPVDPGDDPWSVDPSGSPTGTTLLPTAPHTNERGGLTPQPTGYAVVDEVCGAFAVRDGAPSAASTFAAPLFRSLAVAGSFAWAVDGTNLWTFAVDPDGLTPPEGCEADCTPLAVPRFVAVTALSEAGEAHRSTPVAVDVDSSGANPVLWVATIDGLWRHTIAPDGLPDTGELIALPGEGPVLDVALHGPNTVLLARGAEGVTRLTLGPSGDVVEALEVPGLGLANSLTVSGDRLAVAACLEVRIHALDEHLTQLWRLSMPYGQAKGVAVEGDRVYIAAGLALLAVQLGASPRLLGHYTDTAPGFYVNDVLVRNGVIYVAAGDQSVRAVRLGHLEAGVPFTWDAPDPAVDTPEALPTPALDVQDFVVQRDPLALTLAGNTLYALGNFRYRGQRTIEVFDVELPGTLRTVGRWEEPNHLASLGRLGDGVLAAGPGGLWSAAAPTSDVAERLVAASVGPLAARGDVALMATTDGQLYQVGCDGPCTATASRGVSPVGAPTPVGDLALDDTLAYVARPDEDALAVGRLDPPDLLGLLLDDQGFLGEAAVATTTERVVVYDRVTGLLSGYQRLTDALPARVSSAWVGPCEAYDYASTFDGSRQARARFATDGDRLFLLCPRPLSGPPTVLTLDPLSLDTVATTALSDGAACEGRPEPCEDGASPVMDLALSGDHLAALTWDPARLETRLQVLHAGDGSPVAEARFLGHGAGVVGFPDGGWAVGDAFWGRLWRFDAALARTSGPKLAP